MKLESMMSFTIKELLGLLILLQVVNLSVLLNLVFSNTRMKNELQYIYDKLTRKEH